MLGKWFTALGAFSSIASAQIQLDISSDASIKAAARIAAANAVDYYVGNQTGQIPGELPAPYYWWECGAMFGQLINYWQLTGDTSYNAIVKQGLLFQIGADKNYMPANQSSDLGNDDQAFWSFSAMDAAESGFENPDSSYPSWVALAQAVWNTQYPRWDMKTCGGGLRWQIFIWNAGYTYKNTIANGAFFQLSARLYRYTGNQTYADWAEKAWTWIYDSPIMGQSYAAVWDGTHVDTNCTDVTELYWTYNVGTLIMGSAYMFNATNGNATWAARVNGLMGATDVFFRQSNGASTSGQPPANGSIMAEVACEFPAVQTCNYDEPSFKAYLSRWLAVAGQLVPSLEPTITPLLQGSAKAAAAICMNPGPNGRTQMCSRRWYQTVSDGNIGVGEQMSALSVMQNLLIKNVAPPLTLKSGATSASNPNAGAGSGQGSGLAADSFEPITTGDQAGAAILTILSIALISGGTAWIVM